MKLVLTFIVLCAGIAFCNQLPAAWRTYTNVRFQYSICYPADLLKPQGEAANGDGQKFIGKDDAQLVVYGRNNALNETLQAAMNAAISSLAGKQGRITYKAMKPNWFVISGISGPSIFYAKTLFSHGRFKSFELTYRKSAAPVYNALAGRIAACFRDLAP